MDFVFHHVVTALSSFADTIAPAGGAVFDVVAVFSLLCYLVFAVVALHYALKPWAEKVMFASIAVGAVASLLLHLSLRESPAYVGEGPLWKFVVLSQYVPMGLVIFGGLYGVYWGVKRLKR